jgi:hypothetical protein
LFISFFYIASAATNLNIAVARPHFEKFVQQNVNKKKTNIKNIHNFF